MDIVIDSPTTPDVTALLDQHLRDMFATSPAESVHALDHTGLAAEDVTLWAAREDGRLLGVGALRRIDAQHGEIKSMRTADDARGRGVAGGGAPPSEPPRRRGPSAGVAAAQPRDGEPGLLRARAAPLRPARVREVRSVRRLRARPQQHLHDASAGLTGQLIPSTASRASDGSSAETRLLAPSRR